MQADVGADAMSLLDDFESEVANQRAAAVDGEDGVAESARNASLVALGGSVSSIFDSVMKSSIATAAGGGVGLSALAGFQPSWMESLKADSMAQLASYQPGWMESIKLSSSSRMAEYAAGWSSQFKVDSAIEAAGGALGAGLDGMAVGNGLASTAAEMFSVCSNSMAEFYGSGLQASSLRASLIDFGPAGLSLREMAGMPLVDSVSEIMGKYRSTALDGIFDAVSTASLSRLAGVSSQMMANLGMANPVSSVLDGWGWATSPFADSDHRPVGDLYVPSAEPPVAAPALGVSDADDYMVGLAMGLQALQRGGLAQLRQVRAAVTSRRGKQASAVAAILAVETLSSLVPAVADRLNSLSISSAVVFIVITLANIRGDNR